MKAEGVAVDVEPRGPARFRPVTIPAKPIPSRAELLDAFSALRHVVKRKARPDDLGARDEAFIRDFLPLMDVLYDHYFRCETELEAELPAGPFLAVANHNGMTGTPDMFCHMTAFWRHETPSRLAYGLMHDMPFHVPGAGALLNASGAIAASHKNAQAALERGAAVLVFPGGDVDACKPYGARYEVRFGNRRGFIRLALRMGVPIVPVVSVGGHESLYIANDGAWIAERLGLKRRFRSNVFPLGVSLPWGLIVGLPYPHWPLPVKVHTRFSAPILFGEAKHAADDPHVVEACFDRVVSSMQATMAELRAAGRHGLFPRGGAS